MDTTDHHVPASGRIAQVGQVEVTVEVTYQGEGTTSLQVGLLSEYLVGGPHNSGVRGTNEAVLRRGGCKHHVKILDQGEYLRLGVDGGEAGVPMGNCTC